MTEGSSGSEQLILPPAGQERLGQISPTEASNTFLHQERTRQTLILGGIAIGGSLLLTALAALTTDSGIGGAVEQGIRGAGVAAAYLVMSRGSH